MMMLALAALAAGCTKPEDARQALEGAGFTQIELGGYGWFACDEKDTFSTKFTATGPTGKRVSGVVCSGLLKGNTIRMD
ncbi:MAG TPA: hypothetical protein DCZ11_03230 [Gammaproteobacteria bacterium]|nr:hypothetical protein [Gammaproteobacteria bacterium]MCH77439.1 hypothetical protein [Gammaproteobacteria bacterium]